MNISLSDAMAIVDRAISRADAMGAPMNIAFIGVTGLPQAADDDARQVHECRRYLTDVAAALDRSATPAELIDRMTYTYPDFANPHTLWVAAYDLLGARTESRCTGRQRSTSAAYRRRRASSTGAR